jgi:hypothetical protein
MVIWFLMTSGTTPYQPMSYRGGYSEAEVEPNTFFLEYLGTAHTGLPTIVGYWHRRANESVQRERHGFDYFGS